MFPTTWRFLLLLLRCNDDFIELGLVDVDISNRLRSCSLPRHFIFSGSVIVRSSGNASISSKSDEYRSVRGCGTMFMDDMVRWSERENPDFGMSMLEDDLRIDLRPVLPAKTGIDDLARSFFGLTTFNRWKVPLSGSSASSRYSLEVRLVSSASFSACCRLSSSFCARFKSGSRSSKSSA
ncbi:hypothetical protein OGAPHI_002507 [Ogataea philodendri]|uniref:Secreted protein n=1 Tax=Ogataea philodendri TaxID=1378263 RepID=A0A9P8PBE1_9ASCO|nr:uncharacterized protein OGAPHI_002507 [Ogataea philodendri]KAH3668752.1 hypothetical protein OGAPHI_002507 [Ogataea philodendri]